MAESYINGAAREAGAAAEAGFGHPGTHPKNPPGFLGVNSP